eukprot:1426042-Rhodomonas_salina.1
MSTPGTRQATDLGQPAEQAGVLAVGQRGAGRCERRARQRDARGLLGFGCSCTRLQRLADHAQRPRRHPHSAAARRER